MAECLRGLVVWFMVLIVVALWGIVVRAVHLKERHAWGAAVIGLVLVIAAAAQDNASALGGVGMVLLLFGSLTGAYFWFYGNKRAKAQDGGDATREQSTNGQSPAITLKAEGSQPEGEVIQCPHCGVKNSKTATSCGHCGDPLASREIAS